MRGALMQQLEPACPVVLNCVVYLETVSPWAECVSEDFGP